MKIKISLTAILLFLCSAQIVFAQEKVLSGGIINGRATKLPTPDYPQEAKDLCASGQVKVQVLTDEDGNVVSAEAISGDELLRNSAVEAAKNAKFSPTPEIRIKQKGIVIYNFPAEKRCIEKGVINNRAIYLPQPVFPKSCRCQGKIYVRVLVDVSSGKVVTANVISGHPLLRASAIKAAREARFGVANIDGDGKPVYVKGILVYDFDSSGSVQSAQEQKQIELPKANPIKDAVQGILIGKATNLVKPQIPFCDCIWGGAKGVTSVLVQAEIDEQGNVSKATAISGHPLLKITSEKAAQKSKFTPSLDSGERVKAKATIVYKFTIVNKMSVKFASVEVKDIQIEIQPKN